MGRGLLILLTLGFCFACCIEWWDIQAEYAARYGRVPEFYLPVQMAWWVGIVAVLLAATWLGRRVSALRDGPVAGREGTRVRNVERVLRWVVIGGVAIATGAVVLFCTGYLVFFLTLPHDGSSTSERLGNLFAAVYSPLSVLAGLLAGIGMLLETRSEQPLPQPK